MLMMVVIMVVMIDNNDGDCDVTAKFPWWLNDEDTDDEDGDGVIIMVNLFPKVYIV